MELVRIVMVIWKLHLGWRSNDAAKGVEKSYARQQAPDFVADMNRRFEQMNLVLDECGFDFFESGLLVDLQRTNKLCHLYLDSKLNNYKELID